MRLVTYSLTCVYLLAQKFLFFIHDAFSLYTTRLRNQIVSVSFVEIGVTF